MIEHRDAIEVRSVRDRNDQAPWLISRLCGHRPYRVGEPYREGRVAWPEQTFCGIDHD